MSQSWVTWIVKWVRVESAWKSESSTTLPPGQIFHLVRVVHVQGTLGTVGNYRELIPAHLYPTPWLRGPQAPNPAPNPSAPPVSAVTRDLNLMARRRAALATGLRGDYKALNRQSRAAIRRDCRDHIKTQISERGHRDMWRCVKPIIGSKKGASVVPNVHPAVLNE